MPSLGREETFGALRKHNFFFLLESSQNVPCETNSTGESSPHTSLFSALSLALALKCPQSPSDVRGEWCAPEVSERDKFLPAAVAGEFHSGEKGENTI